MEEFNGDALRPMRASSYMCLLYVAVLIHILVWLCTPHDLMMDPCLWGSPALKRHPLAANFLPPHTIYSSANEFVRNGRGWGAEGWGLRLRGRGACSVL